MRLPWRKKGTVKHEPEEDEKQAVAEASLEHAQESLGKVRTQRAHGAVIANTLRAIREENHFQDLWTDGLR